jgi:flagellar protein FlbT
MTMALKIALKPHEKMIIDGAVVRNGSHRCELYIENSVTILRQKDILSETEASTPARRIYFAIQLMYVDEQNLELHHKAYWKLVQEFIAAAPSTLAAVDLVSDHILKGEYYHALKGARKLIEYEKEVVERVQQIA